MIRIWLGVIMLHNVKIKVTSLEDTLAFFASIGCRRFFVYGVIATETIHGLFMIIGFSLSSAPIKFIAVLVGAIFSWPNSKRWVNGYEYELFLAITSLAISVAYADKKYLTIKISIYRIKAIKSSSNGKLLPITPKRLGCSCCNSFLSKKVKKGQFIY
ncbi:DoxX family protein [Enterococcus faecalis]|uniref:DoxX family protein n=1 Tax=Enterococcus faecalis TaxID=1351 RepID=UPI003DA0CC4F